MGHYTSSMKTLSNYAPILTNRSVTLDKDYYVHRATKLSAISLGNYDPDHFQVLYRFAVSSLQSEKLSARFERTNCFQMDFAEFRLTVLWSFLSLPSNHRGRLVFVPTVKPEEMHLLHDDNARSLAHLLPAGLPALRMIPEFVELAALLKEDCIQRSVEADFEPDQWTPDELEQWIRLLTITGQFFKEGTVDRLRYKQHMSRYRGILARGDFDGILARGPT